MKWLCAYRITRQNLTRLTKAMNDEAKAIVFYQQLLRMTQDHENREILTHILEDEKRHLHDLECVYLEITGCRLTVPQPITPYITSFCDGLLDAFFDELDAYEDYRNLYLANPNMRRRNVFFANMTDENEHAMQLNYLINKMSCRRRSHYSEEELHKMHQERKQASGTTSKGSVRTAGASSPTAATPASAASVAGNKPTADQSRKQEQKREQERKREQEQERARTQKQSHIEAESSEKKKFDLEVELGMDVDVDLKDGLSVETEFELEAEMEIEASRHHEQTRSAVQEVSSPRSASRSGYPQTAGKDNRSLDRIDHLWEFAKKDRK